MVPLFVFGIERRKTILAEKCRVLTTGLVLLHLLGQVMALHSAEAEEQARLLELHRESR